MKKPLDGGSSRPVRPILRWAGSKRKLMPVVSSYWKASYERYVEPFAGSGTLFYHLLPNSALLADKNDGLIDMYKTLRRTPRALHRAVGEIAVNRATFERVRALDPSSLGALDRATRFVYLNRNCFNGLFRTNAAGEFNVPFASDRLGRLPTLEAFVEAAAALSGAKLRAWDFGTTLRYCKKGDFVYLDPPYATASRRVFSEYGPRSFNTTDLNRLGEHLKKLDSRGVHFLVSYADCREARALAAPWNHRFVIARRNIAGFVAKRRLARELLISNTTAGAFNGN